MALDLIEPFCYQEYHARTQDFASWLANHVQANAICGRTGWIAWFQTFGFNKCGSGPIWKRGVLNRAKYHKKLKGSLCNNNDHHLIRVVNEIIIKLHGMGAKSSCTLKDAPRIREALNLLKSESGNLGWSPQKLYNLRRIAPMSKVYQMLDPHRWTIYDSRVATALACLVRRFWYVSGQEINSELMQFIYFCVPSRHNAQWSRPKGFHGCTTSRQACLAFIYASWLLRQVAEIMRSDSKYGVPPTINMQYAIQPLDGNWQVYHLEMALWMLGDSEF